MSLEGYNDIKKRRSSLTGVVTRMRNRYRRLAEGDPTNFDLDNMANSLDTTVQHFLFSQEEVMAYVDVTVETPFNEDNELAAIETFEDNVDATKSLINRLMTTKRTLRSANLIRSDLDNLEDQIKTMLPRMAG